MTKYKIKPYAWLYELGDFTTASRTRLELEHPSEVETPLYLHPRIPIEPVAWMYEKDGKRHVFGCRLDESCLGPGYAETALYAMPAPPVGGDQC